jgi:hypothetical protein
MIRVLPIVVACGALCLSCGNSSDVSPVEPIDTIAKPEFRLSPEESSKPAEVDSKVLSTDFIGEAKVTSGKEDEAYRTAKVELSLMENDRLVGRLTLDGKPLVLGGLKDGENMRLWAVAGAGGDDVRRGVLFATAQGSRFEGNLSISGNGGEPVFTGTWSVTHQSQ